MGCTQSKIENEETVTRCKDRRQFMKDAVSARNAFAAAHSAYAVFLKNTGAALSDYSHGEVESSSSAAAAPSSVIRGPLPPIPQPSYDSFPPPPPLPNFTSSPLQRAATMPEFSIPEPDLKHSDTIIEEENEDEIDNESAHSHSLRHRSTRSSGGGARSGVTRAEVEDEGLAPPPSPPRAPPQINRATPPPPPPPEAKGMASWEFFFPSMENVPGTNLAELEESSIDRGNIERKMYEEMPEEVEDNSVDASGNGKAEAEVEVEVEVEETVAEPPPELPAAVAVKPMKKVVDGKRAVKSVPGVSLLQVCNELDDCFLKASESAHEVSKMLEATRLHYHSNFADNRGHIDHSARLMRVITWNRSFKGLLNTDDGKDDFDSEEHETHATILDKMLAWEKKLYDEVKAGEQMKLEYQRKVASLTKLKKRGTNTEALERAKAAVSQLHTRYIVDMQSMDSTVSEINRLRDEQLYPKLVALIDGMSTMWETMRMHHESQSKIVRVLRSVDISHSSIETSEQHHQRTVQLWNVVREWQSQFEKLMSNQKDYIKALNNWLKLNLIPIDNNLKEKVSSPQRPQNPLIQSLLHTWQDYLEKLPEELARTAIHNFTAVVDTIVQYQVDEIKLLTRCKDTQNELDRKTKQFNDWLRKYEQRRTPPDEMDEDRAQEQNDHVAERLVVVDTLKKRLEEEEEEHRHQCVQVREKSLTTLRTRLPELFRAMSEFSHASSDMYRNLRSMTMANPHSSNEG